MATQQGARTAASLLTSQNINTLEQALKAGMDAAQAVEKLPPKARGIIYTCIGAAFLERGIRILVEVSR